VHRGLLAKDTQEVTVTLLLLIVAAEVEALVPQEMLA
jgi:hypothetical protein